MRKDLKKYLKLLSVGINDPKLLKSILVPPKKTICGTIKPTRKEEKKIVTRQELLNKWSKLIGQCFELVNYDHAKEMALFLENSWRASEVDYCGIKVGCVEMIPIAIRFFQALTIRDLIGIQTFNDLTDGLYYKHGEFETVALRTLKPRVMTARWSDDALQDLRSCCGLDPRAELIAVTAQEMACEVMREIINEILAATGYALVNIPVDQQDYEAWIIQAFRDQEADFATYRGIRLAKGEWILTGPDIADKLVTVPLLDHQFTSSISIHQVGYIDRWRPIPVYKDYLFPEKTVLLGRKLHQNDAGYFWTPYSMGLRKVSGMGWFSDRTEIDLIAEGHMIDKDYFIKLNFAG